jgi:hypothetical protein
MPMKISLHLYQQNQFSSLIPCKYMIEIFDPNMDTALKWANEIGLPPLLPKSLEDVDQRAKLVDHMDSKLIQNSFLHELDAKEKASI